MRTLLISGGDYSNPNLILKYSKNSFIVCVDNGIKNLSKLNIIPNVLIGDLDSISNEDLEYAKKNNVSILKFNKYKNESDTELALDFLIKNGTKKIIILSAIGSRIDHSLVNIFLLEKLYNANINAKMFFKNNEIRFIAKGKYSISKNKYKYLSIIPISKKLKYSIFGCEYEAKNLIIKRDSSRSLSNEINKEKAKIIIHAGKGLLIKSND